MAMDKVERGPPKIVQKIAEIIILAESGTSQRKKTEGFIHCMPITNRLFKHKMALIQGVLCR